MLVCMLSNVEHIKVSVADELAAHYMNGLMTECFGNWQIQEWSQSLNEDHLKCSIPYHSYEYTA